MRRLALAILASFTLHIFVLAFFLLFGRSVLPLAGGGEVNIEIVQESDERSRSEASLGKLSSEDKSQPGSARLGPGSGTETGTDPLLAQIRSRIEQAKHYPALAKKSGIGGRALVRFQIDEVGQPEGIVLKQSSGSEVLDSEALGTIRRAAPFPQYKDPLEVWIRFEIKL